MVSVNEQYLDIFQELDICGFSTKENVTMENKEDPSSLKQAFGGLNDFQICTNRKQKLPSFKHSTVSSKKSHIPKAVTVQVGQGCSEHRGATKYEKNGNNIKVFPSVIFQQVAHEHPWERNQAPMFKT